MNSYQSFPLDVAKGIKMLVLDVDGVLTEGHVTMTDNGDEIKNFNVRDGHGIKMLQRAGIEVAILTGRKSKVVAHRAADLGIKYLIQGSLRKADGLKDLCEQAGILPQDCAYMGDDVIDLPAMRQCRLQSAPSNAFVGVLKHATWVSEYAGGHGAVRQLCEGLILANGGWEHILEQAYGVTPQDCGW
ncbi:KdsC family phosphatase [Ghiorsea bivora]|uniref:KdsC family phosphatase n=1 Tax=Ghiorsea bivora TaxID=1485545 RepID=UPI000571E9AD|nr:HAD-IIIA family hydrolase [Ghiorsea bivora]